MSASAVNEPVSRVADLVPRFGMSASTIRRLIRTEPGVLWKPGPTGQRRTPYVPEPVVRRLLTKLANPVPLAVPDRQMLASAR